MSKYESWHTGQQIDNAIDVVLIKGQPGGLAELDNTGKVPSSQLPSYVDDVIEGYYYGGNFYEDSAHTELITPETSKIYVDLVTNKVYRYGGSTYVEIAPGSLVTVTTDIVSGTKTATISVNGVAHDIYYTDTTYESKSASSGGIDVSLVTTGEKYNWNNKQNLLISGTNIKTINNESLLGSGNIDIQGGGGISDVTVDGTSVVTGDVAVISLSGKQDTLVSGTNIKTINNTSILGSGNIDIQGGSGISDVTVDGTSVVTGDVAVISLSGKQDALVSGTNIKTINNTSILGSGNIDIQAPTYTAGYGIDIINGVISVDLPSAEQQSF